MNPAFALLFSFIGELVLLYFFFSKKEIQSLLCIKSLFSFNCVLHKPSHTSSPFPFPWGRIGWAFFFLLIAAQSSAQTSSAPLWHNKERTIHYLPQGNDFVLYKGTRKFNRALYGTNTAFRVEAGDLPEFAMYMPGMGGNCKMGIVANNNSKWVTEASSIKTIYRPGSMLYEIKDSLLGKGQINISVLALAAAEGMVCKIETNNIPAGVSLVILYGGATGKKFSRDGDIGADPESSFYLKPEYCNDNRYSIDKNLFQLTYGFTKPLSEEERYEIQYGNKQADTNAKEKPKQIIGVFPDGAEVKVSDADKQASPIELLAAAANLKQPVVTGTIILQAKQTLYFITQKKEQPVSYADAPAFFAKAEAARKKLAERIILQTPDSFINPLGGALAIAADGIWEDPSYMHGAIAWRMRLPAWRGAYCADPLGWHDRARMHFSSYALSQVTKIPEGPLVFDTALHIARQQEKMGTAMFSNGYICRNPNGDIRPHHYDMNLVFVDQLLNHFNYTGDIDYVKKMWPLITLHLQWEKRNFDADGDGLYDAYAAIWASDGLQYSGGGVTHSSAYNYRANKTAAMLAKLIGEDGSMYEAEANKIYTAMQNNLWLKDKGWYAEYKDLLGLKQVHPSAALWTVYHAIDEGTATQQQQHQLLRYTDNYIPHIPVKINGLKDEGYYLLATSNWQPYTWSINNVTLGENLHAALAYWQGGENDNAFKLWKSALVESMYASASPGGLQQLSFYDAARGELYRDFADGIGVAARTLTEGLFGILPDALNDKLIIKPGFPSAWQFAKLSIPDISIDFKQQGNTSVYNITQSYSKLLNVTLQVKALKDKVVSVTVNGKAVKWQIISGIAQQHTITIQAGKEKSYVVKISWAGKAVESFNTKPATAAVTNTEYNTQYTPPSNAMFTAVNLQPYFNDNVTQIFKNKYLYPRPQSPTLQLPWQGIGNWCYPLTEANISDSGLRVKAGAANKIYFNKIPFATPGAIDAKNIIYTSQWDNYPKAATIPLSGKAQHAYLLMAGSTNPMQSQFTNGIVVVKYKDGTMDTLELINPKNWCPIEQDYFEDGYAFTTGAAKPYRLLLKTGEFVRDIPKLSSIKGFSNRAIDGGAATLLEMPLNKNKELESLTVETRANDVVIGLMSLTLVNGE